MTHEEEWLLTFRVALHGALTGSHHLDCLHYATRAAHALRLAKEHHDKLDAMLAELDARR